MRHVGIGLSMQQPHRAIDRNGRVQQQQLLSIGPQARICRCRLGAIGIGLIDYLARREFRLVRLALAPLGKVRCRSYADQPRTAFGAQGEGA